MSELWRKVFVGIGLSGLLIALTGCSTFNRDWKRAASGGPSPANGDGLIGRWEGSWKSDANGHTGRLRCLMTNTGTNYVARFHANFWKILTFNYAVPLQVKQQDGAYQFSGEANLGWYAGGRYEYQGDATSANFHSTYRAKSDHGTFDMIRPK